MQFYSMTKIENLQTLFKDQPLLLEHFCDEQNLDRMKKILIRYSVEEALRRVSQNAEEAVESENILNILFDGHQKFHKTLCEARKEEIEERFAPKPSQNEFEKYDSEVARVCEALGYQGLSNASKLDSDVPMASESKPEVDFGLAVSNLVKSKPWKSPALQQ